MKSTQIASIGKTMKPDSSSSGRVREPEADKIIAGDFEAAFLVALLLIKGIVKGGADALLST